MQSTWLRHIMLLKCTILPATHAVYQFCILVHKLECYSENEVHWCHTSKKLDLTRDIQEN